MSLKGFQLILTQFDMLDTLFDRFTNSRHVLRFENELTAQFTSLSLNSVYNIVVNKSSDFPILHIIFLNGKIYMFLEEFPIILSHKMIAHALLTFGKFPP